MLKQYFISRPLKCGYYLKKTDNEKNKYYSYNEKICLNFLDSYFLIEYDPDNKKFKQLLIEEKELIKLLKNSSSDQNLFRNNLKEMLIYEFLFLRKKFFNYTPKNIIKDEKKLILYDYLNNLKISDISENIKNIIDDYYNGVSIKIILEL